MTEKLRGRRLSVQVTHLSHGSSVLVVAQHDCLATRSDSGPHFLPRNNDKMLFFAALGQSGRP